jgi:beta propeller repeat protein
MLNGTTIITHGQFGNVTDWVDAMANEIRARVPSSLTTGEYTLSLFGDTAAAITHSTFTRTAQDSTTTAQTATSGETIIKLDWSKLADAVFPLNPPNESTRFVGQYVANLLLGGLGIDVLSGPIHLIGHSRGASVNTSIAQVLAEHNIWVDQFTTLDPHPVDGLKGDDFVNWDDTPISVWDNVRFADNYYREDSDPADFDGEPVTGAFNVHFDENELHPGYPLEHSDVHLWYHGTIDTAGPIDDGSVSVPENAGWYDGLRGPRNGNGYYFSRIAMGSRVPTAVAGLAHLSNRESVAAVGEQWPNLEASLQFSGSQSVIQGDQITMVYRYQAVSDVRITFGYDVDQNPLNGHTDIQSVQRSATSTGASFDDGSLQAAALSTQDVVPGVYYIYARIGETGRERYAYTKRQLTVLPAGQANFSLSLPGNMIDDSTAINRNNDNDHLFESGEEVDIRPRLTNTGNAKATGITLAITYAGPGIEPFSDTLQYPDLNPGQSGYPLENKAYRLTAPRAFADTVSTQALIDWDQNLNPSPIVYPGGISISVLPTAWLALAPKIADFGAVPPGIPAVVDLAVTNSGTAAMSITSFVTSHPDTTVAPSTFGLGPAQSQTVKVTINTNSIGDGTLLTRDVRVVSTGRTSDPSIDEHLMATGLVSQFVQSLEVSSIAGASGPDVGSPWVVWSEPRFENYDIFALNLETGEELQITNNPANQSAARVSGGLIAWEDDRNGGTSTDIYGFDLNTRTEFVVANDDFEKRLIGVDDGTIAFTKPYHVFTEPASPKFVSNIWLYDRTTQTPINLTNFVANANQNPMNTVGSMYDFAGGRLVWNEATRFFQNGSWGTSNPRTRMHMKGGLVDTSPVPNTVDTVAVDGSRIVWSAEDTNRDNQIFLWEASQGTRQLTMGGSEFGGRVLAIGGTRVSYDRTTTDLYFTEVIQNPTVEHPITRDKTLRDARMDAETLVYEIFNPVTSLNEVWVAFLQLRLPGDYDGNRTVGQADYNLWKARFGTTVAVPGLGPDGNSNGSVDLADYVVWRNNSGNASAFAVSASNAVESPLALRGQVFNQRAAGVSTSKQPSIARHDAVDTANYLVTRETTREISRRTWPQLQQTDLLYALYVRRHPEMQDTTLEHDSDRKDLPIEPEHVWSVAADIIDEVFLQIAGTPGYHPNLSVKVSD